MGAKMFDDDFLNDLPKDRYEAARRMCKEFFRKFDGMPDPQKQADSAYYDFLGAYAAVEVFCETYGISTASPEITNNRAQNLARIRDCFAALFVKAEDEVTRKVLENARNHYTARFNQSFAYEFSDNDLRRIQDILNELRDLIRASKLIDDDHRGRLLKQLEALQRELHKRVSSLDRFLGFLAEAGMILGQFGKDAKPIMDRIRELVQIISQVSAMAQGLPGATPFLMLSGQTYPTDQEQPESSTESDN